MSGIEVTVEVTTLQAADLAMAMSAVCEAADVDDSQPLRVTFFHDGGARLELTDLGQWDACVQPDGGVTCMDGSAWKVRR